MAGDVGKEFLEAVLGESDALFALARRLTGGRGQAEDLVQETYLHAYRAWARQRPRDVRAWLVTICLNLARSEARRRAAHPETLTPDPPAAPDGGDVADDALRALTAVLVHRALAALSEEQRLAVTLVDLCGFTSAQAARVLGCPRGTVLSRVHRGRKALARLLAGDPRLAEVTGR
ncbi:MAG TPA: RNA polymerase sigma factor [Streptosporangiaceae bacterium]|nr:RNA polymerase sigma factor [Streptosporangiaceae bacterium]